MPRIVGYAETVVPLYSVDDFKDHFCLRRYTFEQFEKDISDCDELKFGGRGKTPVTVEKHALMFLWYIGECWRAFQFFNSFIHLGAMVLGWGLGKHRLQRV